MADATEVHWGCGCREVNGVLEVECTQVPHQGELSAERHAVARPYSAKCFRLFNAQVGVEPSQLNTAVITATSSPTPTSEPAAAAAEPAPTPEPTE